MVVFIKNNRQGPKFWASNRKGIKGLLLTPGQNRISDEKFESFLKNDKNFAQELNDGKLSLILPPEKNITEVSKKSKKIIKEASDIIASSNVEYEIKKAELVRQQAELDIMEAEKALENANKEDNKSCEDLKAFNADEAKNIIVDVMDIRILEEWEKEESRKTVLKAISDQIKKITPEVKG